MKKTLLFLLGSFLFSMVSAQNINLGWATQFEGAQSLWNYGMCTDASGNVYATGGFYDTADFNPGPGQYLLMSPGNYNIYISKQDASGNIVWARNIGGIASDFGNEVTVDNAGNVYITGYFNGIVDFDPGPGFFNLTALAGSQAFVLKLDANGDFVWAKHIDGTSVSGGVGIAVDNAQNLVVSGQFQAIIDADPGAGVTNFTSAGGNDIFLIKLDAAGNFLWATQTGGIENDFTHEITMDNAGNIYSTGHYKNVVDFDPGPGVLTFISAGAEDNFIAKYDGNGVLIWAKTTGGINGDFAFSLDVDAAGNVYYGGSFSGSIDMDPGVGVFNLTAFAFSDVCFSKLDASGNLVWAKQTSGDGSESVKSLRLDASGNVYLFGDYGGLADFDPGPGVFNMSGFLDMFLCKLTNNGDFIDAVSIGAGSWEESRSLAIDAGNNLYISGTFNDIVDFDPGAGLYLLDAGTDKNVFINKLSQNFPLPVQLFDFTAKLQSGIVILNWETAYEQNTDHFVVQKSNDALHWQNLNSIAAAGNSTEKIKYENIDKEPLQGISYYRLAMYDHDDNINYSKTVQVFQDKNDALSYGPNPTEGIVYFNRACSFVVFNTSGTQIASQTNSQHLDLTAFAAGTYFVSVLEGIKETMNIKVMKKN